jgi:hypothetical protein
MTSIVECDEATCAQLPVSQLQQIADTPISRAQTLIASTDVWQNFYRQQLPELNAPWWAYRYTKQERFSGVLWVDESLPYFNGHFPGNPILPGVVQIQWALDTAGEAFAAAPATKFAGMSQIKFKAPIQPRTWLQLSLVCRAQVVTFEVSDGQTVRTQGRLQFHA